MSGKTGAAKEDRMGLDRGEYIGEGEMAGTGQEARWTAGDRMADGALQAGDR